MAQRRDRSLRESLERPLLLGAGFGTFGVFGLAERIDRFGREERAAPADAIVVLGAQVWEGGIASPALRARAEKGATLYRRGIAPLVILSGGIRSGPPPSEAEVARAIVVKEGVPESACLLEERSRTTEENAAFTVALMKERGLTTLVVVSDPFHLLRARQHFRKQGVEVLTSPASMERRELSPMAYRQWLYREAFALLGSPVLLLTKAP